jgi:hypothetical protein
VLSCTHADLCTPRECNRTKRLTPALIPIPTMHNIPLRKALLSQRLPFDLVECGPRLVIALMMPIWGQEIYNEHGVSRTVGGRRLRGIVLTLELSVSGRVNIASFLWLGYDILMINGYCPHSAGVAAGGGI